MIVEDRAAIRGILTTCKTIAVVGISIDPSRPSFGVAQFMQQRGYKIVPVNPRYDEVLGETCFSDLASIPFPVDIVNCFRRAEDIPPIAQAAAQMRPLPKVLWMQLGIESDEAARLASDAGIQVVMNRCLEIEALRL